MQKYVQRSHGMRFERFLTRLDIAVRHYDAYRRYGPSGRQDFTALDLGTGWFPIVPIALWLCGAKQVLTFDIARHVNPSALTRTFELFRNAHDNGALQKRLPHFQEKRLKQLLDIDPNGAPPEKVLAKIGITYRVTDLVDAALPSMSIDLIVSNAVLEYLDRDRFLRVLKHFHRLLRPDGVMNHWIDLSDEFAYFDPSISRLNFLRFSDRAWNLIVSPLLPLSRLRLTDCLEVMEEAGFELADVDAQRMSEDEFASLHLAPRFKTYPRDDIRVLDAWIVALPAKENRVAALGETLALEHRIDVVARSLAEEVDFAARSP